MSARPIGIIAGKGALPSLIAKEARAQGRKVIAIALEPVTETVDGADTIERIHVGKLGSVIKFLKTHRVKEAVMAGKISKTLLYGQKIRPDLRAAALLFRLKDRSDDSIINAVSREFEKDGIRLLGIPEICPGLLTPEGVLTERRPTEREWKDIEFGFRIAKEIGRLDIGQTVVVKDRAVIAVEAIEGTDEAIRRGGALAGEGTTVVKVIRPNQDIRFDMPVVGLDTLSAIKEAQAHVLCLEAQKSIFLDKEEFIKQANSSKIAVVGYRA